MNTKHFFIKTKPINLTTATKKYQKYNEKTVANVETGCLIWQGSKNRKGYGRIKVDGANRLAHRVAWQAANNQEIPEGYTVDHLCFNTSCVNPDHMEIVSPLVNNQRAAHKRRIEKLSPEMKAARSLLAGGAA